MNLVHPTRGAGALQPPPPVSLKPAPRILPFPRPPRIEDDISVDELCDLLGLDRPRLRLHAEAER